MGRNLLKPELTLLKQSLPYHRGLLDHDEVIIDRHYKHLAICIFDHWLHRDEMDIMFNEDVEVVSSRRQKNENFIEGLLDSTTVWLERYKRERPFVYSPIDKDEVRRKCRLDEASADRGQFYCLILPEFGAVYSEDWDWTNSLWYRDSEKIKPLLKLAEDCGLFKLEIKPTNPNTSG